MKRAILMLLWVGWLPLLPACTTKKVAGPVEDEPVCSDFHVGASRTEMKGGLKKPVRVTLLDDDDPISSRILLGKRSAADPAAMLSVPDGNEEYVVEWAQCDNERAPRPTHDAAHDQREMATYACGEAKVYAKTELKVRAGDAASRAIHFVAPPDPACWADTGPEAASETAPEPSATAAAAPDVTASASASASPAPTATASAGAAAPSAAPKTAPAAATDAPN